MSQVKTVLLDNEAVQALADPGHRNHRQVIAMVEVLAVRNLRRVGSVRLVVPTAVRVEAGWNRRSPKGAVLNRLRVGDEPLDGAAANRAAGVRAALAVSVADAHLAATLLATTKPHAILTSDPDDLRRIAKHLGVELTVVTI